MKNRVMIKKDNLVIGLVDSVIDIEDLYFRDYINHSYILNKNGEEYEILNLVNNAESSEEYYFPKSIIFMNDGNVCLEFIVDNMKVVCKTQYSFIRRND